METITDSDAWWDTALDLGEFPPRHPGVCDDLKASVFRSQLICVDGGCLIPPAASRLIATEQGEVQSHQFAWMLRHGPILDTSTISRTCQTTECCNPDHLIKGADDRFWVKVDKNGTEPEHMPGIGPCWEWTAGCGPDGYGTFQRGYAHRWSWANANGEIPEGMVIMHRCDNPPCVNPSHLVLGTHADNVRDRESKGRGRYSKLKTSRQARYTPTSRHRRFEECRSQRRRPRPRAQPTEYAQAGSCRGAHTPS